MDSNLIHPDYDVIIPVYNAQSTISQAIISVLNQTIRPKRIIVIDDGSIDGSIAVVQELQKDLSKDVEIIIKSISNSGAANARNVGIRMSTSPIVSFLDADDFWAPEKMQKQITKVPTKGFVHSNCQVLNPNGKIVRKVFNEAPGNFENLLDGSYTVAGSASSVTVSREFLLSVGLFNTDLHIGEDLDLWLRLSRHGVINNVETYDVFIIETSSGVQMTNLNSNPIREISDLIKIISNFKSSEELVYSNILIAAVIGNVNRLIRNPLKLFKFLVDLQKILNQSLGNRIDYKFQRKIFFHICNLLLIKTHMDKITKLITRIFKKIYFEITKLNPF